MSVLPPTAARRGPAPRVAVGIELAHEIGKYALLPWRLLEYLVTRSSLRGEIEADLQSEPRYGQALALEPPLDRPVDVFVSCAEASGELHAQNLVSALREKLETLGSPAPRVSGLGGPGLEALGVGLLGNPVQRADMGLASPFRGLSFYLGLLESSARHFRDHRPDVCVMVDSPALHVPLGRIARRYGVPVVHFVTPQYWGWAPWRIGEYRSAVDLALTILPFEPAWFERRRIQTVHVGHPLLDELRGIPSTTPPRESKRLVLLPGSRARVVERNLPWMLAAGRRLKQRIPEVELVLPHGRPELEPLLRSQLRAAGAEGLVQLELGDLHATLARARSALAVSGTILLDLLHHRLPAVVVYRLGGRVGTWMYQNLLSTPYFASVNLLAAREVLPEFCFHGEGPVNAIDQAIERAYSDQDFRTRCASELELAASRLGPPGACARAADQVLLLALRAQREGRTPA